MVRFTAFTLTGNSSLIDWNEVEFSGVTNCDSGYSGVQIFSSQFGWYDKCGGSGRIKAKSSDNGTSAIKHGSSWSITKEDIACRAVFKSPDGKSYYSDSFPFRKIIIRIDSVYEVNDSVIVRFNSGWNDQPIELALTDLNSKEVWLGLKLNSNHQGLIGFPKPEFIRGKQKAVLLFGDELQIRDFLIADD
jgi:hypothetical protein